MTAINNDNHANINDQAEILAASLGTFHNLLTLMSRVNTNNVAPQNMVINLKSPLNHANEANAVINVKTENIYGNACRQLNNA